MVKPQQSWLYCLALFLAVSCEVITGLVLDDSMMKSADYLSPEFAMKPGSVVNKFYYNIDFPKGHIGIKDFNAEVVDEAGNSVSLQDTYLHHWVVVRYYVRKGLEDKGLRSKPTLRQGPDFMVVRNTGVCKNLGQYFGLGSETRKTVTHVPDPYAIEVGNPDEVPEGFEERWLVNVHAIDTRGVVDRLGCTECRCSLYNSTIDEYGRPISPDYEGGLYCCYDQTQCKVKEGFAHSLRKLYLKYTVKWFDWNESFLPVEYEVSPCDSSTVSSNDCIDNKRISFNMPRGGYLVYGVAHQHAGGIGSALYRKDGQAICSSIPTYGQGNEVGNESGYIVGMSTCYPDPGSIKINDGETLVLESNYSSSQKHTGVMGLFYILVSEQLPRQKEISTF
uniref:Stress up-regulated Nod 19 n=1 Tax=Chenopodium quinoa TaxID=63459 RepID=A0A803NBE7_CHEQI